MGREEPHEADEEWCGVGENECEGERRVGGGWGAMWRERAWFQTKKKKGEMWATPTFFEEKKTRNLILTIMRVEWGGGNIYIGRWVEKSIILDQSCKGGHFWFERGESDVFKHPHTITRSKKKCGFVVVGVVENLFLKDLCTLLQFILLPSLEGLECFLIHLECCLELFIREI